MPTEQAAAISRSVDKSISGLTELFKTDATRFFTENDLVCTFHRLVHDALTEIGLDTVTDQDRRPHNLIHCEYPTPFRCDMGGRRFEIKTDDCRTPRGKKYKRGHFDIAVLNPTFVASHPYHVIKGQKYKEFCSTVRPAFNESEPVVLYGVEFVFRRDEIKPSKGPDPEKAANEFVAEVAQDAAKLEEAVRHPGFMKAGLTLAFVKGTSERLMETIRRQLAGLSGIRVFTAS